jgi:hypothetical protein
MLGGRPAQGFEDLIAALEQRDPDPDDERREQLIAQAVSALDAAGVSADDPRRERCARAAGSSPGVRR